MLGRLIRRTNRQSRRLLTTLVTLLLVAQGMPALYWSPTSALARLQETQVAGSGADVPIPPNAVPAPSAGEVRTYDYRVDPSIITDGPVLGEQPLPSVTSPAIIGTNVAPASVSPGITVTLVYTIHVPAAPQDLVLRSAIRNSKGVWITDTARDRLLTVTSGAGVYSQKFVVPRGTVPGKYDVGFSLYSAGYDKVYSFVNLSAALSVNDKEPTPGPAPNTHGETPTVTPTSTPTLPQLVSTDLSPTNAAPNSAVVLSYTVFSPVSQIVSLGAGIRPAGSCCWSYDSANDRTLTIPAGRSTITRPFMLPGDTNVTYDVIWGLWSEGFGTQYGVQQRSNAITVSGPTPTPSVPQLIDVSFAPSSAPSGAVIVLSYTVFSPVGQQVMLGAAIAPTGSGQWTDDPANNLAVNISAGTSTISRQFNLGVRPSGLYDIRWGLWGPNFSTQYGQRDRSGVLTILAVTATPTATSTHTVTNTPTMTPTASQTWTPSSTATPTQPVLMSVDAAPRTTSPGSTLVLSYTVFSPVSQIVSLGAGIRPAGSCCWSYDGANDRTLTIPAGTSVVTRNFSVPVSPTDTGYDVIWGLWSAGFGTQYGVQTRLNYVQVTGPPATATFTVTPTSTNSPTNTNTPASTNTPTVTPTPTQPVLVGVAVNPAITSPGTNVTLSYSIWSPSAQQVALGAGLRVSGGSSGWFYDPANDRTVSIPAGSSVVTRQFAVPVSPTDVYYDVIWGLWSPGFGTQYGVQTRLNAVRVVGPPATPTAPSTPTRTSTPTNTSTPTMTPTFTPVPPTATPTQPVLMSVDAAPRTTSPGSTLVLSYTVFSPVSQIVSLGAGIRPAGSCCWSYDGANDRTLTIPAGTSVVTRNFSVASNADGYQDVIWGLWSAGFGTQYGVQQRNSIVLVSGATPTPSLPTLINVAFEPGTAYSGGTIVLSYTVFSPVGQLVGLGAAVAPNNSGVWVTDPARDTTASVPAGTSIVSRRFNLSGLNAGLYDIRWGLWNAGFTTQYGQQDRNGVLTISAITATPTRTATIGSPTSTPTVGTPTSTVTGTPPTATNTPISTVTPTGATLISVALSSGSVTTGGGVTLSYTIYSPIAASYVLGAQITNDINAYDDPGNNRLVTVPVGTSVVTRTFYIEPGSSPGLYNVIWGLWDNCFTAQYGIQRRDGVLTVIAATPTAAITMSTPTLTPVTPRPSAVTLGVTGPIGGTQVNIGSVFTLNYAINNTTGSTVAVRLGANLTPSGFAGYDTLRDMAQEIIVSVPPGSSSFTRQFTIQSTAGEGSYDLTWSLTDATTNRLLDTRTAKNYLWLKAVGQESLLLSLPSASLVSNSITLQAGAVNYITGNFSILNEDSVAALVAMKMRIKRSGTPNWVTDLPGDKLISVPVGTSTQTRRFAVPLYLPSGSYDVTWELSDSSFTGAIDNVLTNGVLQINNPSPIVNEGVPIFMYHNVNPTTAGDNWVALCNFQQQMDYLVTNGYTTITGDVMYSYIYTGAALPQKPVWLTFDDSYQNIYDYAYPMLNARGLHGSIFTVTQYMGQMNSWDLGLESQHLHMTWDMLRTMRDNGQSADSHTRRHVRLFEIPVSDQRSEIWGTQRDLVSFIGSVGRNFSYPYGQAPDTAKWMVAHSGFQSAVVIGQVKQYTDFADMYELTRIGISSSDTLGTFVNKLTQP